MDYDADGVLDMISGSYDPGFICLFRGLEKGRYAKREVILDEKKVPLVHHPVEYAKYTALPHDKRNERSAIMNRVASFGSWPAMVDWDGDGDLDMLIGSFAGRMFRRENVGTRKQPVFSKVSTAVEADGKPLQVDMHAAPVVADWDGDGTWDLVVGSGTGAVYWYRNTGTAKVPRLGKRRTLVESKSENKFVTRYLAPGERPGPGVRAQVCVTDYDQDGRLDLLVGDYAQIVNTVRKLTKEEIAELEKILGEESTVRYSRTEKNKEEKLKEIRARKAKYVVGTERTSSFVWLLRRKGASAGGGR